MNWIYRQRHGTNLQAATLQGTCSTKPVLTCRTLCLVQLGKANQHLAGIKCHYSAFKAANHITCQGSPTRGSNSLHLSSYYSNHGHDTAVI